ncbi:MAG: 2,3-bisphosphoglycerate-independent phosphoglycerate mutase, partial [Acutalibacteraceae bacterium]
YYAMDRDNRFERVEKAYDAMVFGKGIYNENPVAAIESSYNQIDADGKNITDEFIIPTVCCENGKISANDSIIFFNFRPDRAREITRTFVDEDFDGFKREFFNVFFVCMTQYDATMPNVEIAFKPQSLNNTLGEYLASKNKKQLRIAETEKYAHVTFFFNGGVESVNDGEDRILVASPKVSTYDLQPEMSAYEVADKVVEAINTDKYDVVILNFANCDMVGHTGIFDAAQKAVEAVDFCVGKVVDATLSKGGAVLLTSDHGNAEKMYEPDGSPFTAHTTAPVPFLVAGYDCKLRDGGMLCDIAPTILDMLNLPVPEEMTGKSLI